MTPSLFRRYFDNVYSITKEQQRFININIARYNPKYNTILSSHTLLLNCMIEDANSLFSGKKFYYHGKIVTAGSVFMSDYQNIKIFIIDDIGMTSCPLDALGEICQKTN